METTRKPLLGRIISLLLAACIAVGFVPLIDYSVFAAEPTATIGVLESGIQRSGSGWKWDGSTLELYGAKLTTETNGAAQIIYSGNRPLTINTIGYNYAEGDHPLVKSSTAAVTINGSGIIESDTTGNLFDCTVTINGGFIRAENASAESTIEFKDGYLDIKTISADNMKQTGGVVNCKTISRGYTIENGVLTVQTVTNDSQIMVNGGIVKAFSTESGSHFTQTTDTSILMYVGGAYVDSPCTENTIDIDRIQMKVRCYDVSDATAINACEITSGVVYKNTSFMQINNNATLSGPVYIMGIIFGVYGCSVESGATVFCNSLTAESSSSFTLGENATMYCGPMNIQGCTINGSVYGRSSATINNSKIGATGSVYTGSNYLGYACQIDNIDDDGDNTTNTTIDGSLTVYDGSVEFCRDTNPINGSITAYKKTGNAVTFKKSASLGNNAQLALYAPGNKAVYPSSTVEFDAAVYNKDRTMYSAQTLGDEYMATASVSSLHCGKALYIGNDMGFRLDPTIKDSGISNIFTGKDGRLNTKAKEMPAVPVDGESVKLYYDCTEDIVLDDANVTITKGGTVCTDKFEVTPSHYYKLSDGSEMDRSLCVDIKSKTEIEKGDYDVLVEYNGAEQTDTFKAKDLELTLDFTAASGAWSYGGEFKGVSTDSSGSGWEWRSAYKQLILDNLNFETENLLAIKVPGDTTIILRGENSLHSSSTAILCAGGSNGNDNLTIIGEIADDDSRGKLTATSDVLGQDEPYKDPSSIRCNAVIIALSGNSEHGNVTVKNADLDLWGKKGDEVFASGQSNHKTAHCFGISGKTVKIDNSELKIETGSVSAAGDNLKSYCISADVNIILTGKTSLELKSQGSAVISNPDDAKPTQIKSIQLSKLEGAAITLDDFNSTIKNNSYVYSGAITCTPDSEVKISTKPITQLDDAKTVDVIDPDNGAYRVDLSQFFAGGTGDYIFEFDNYKPNWITLDSTKKILEINPPSGTIYTGGTLKMKVMDNDPSLSSPLLFDFIVGKVKAEVMLNIEYDNTLGTVTPATGKVPVGDNVVIRAEANGNAYISSVKVEGVNFDLNYLTSAKKNKNGRIISGEYAIDDISSGYTIEVEFKELPTFRVQVSNSENGFVTVATAPIDGKPDYTYYEGADVGLSVVAADGYRIKSAKLNGNEVNLTNGSYTIENITANCDFAVEFEALPTYAVTVTCGEHGSYTTDYTGSLSAVREGTVIKFNVTPDNGYRLAKVEVDGTEISASKSFSVTITKATEIALTFSKKSSGGGGGGGTSNKPDANEPVREPYIEASSSIKGWTDIAEYITSNAAALRGKEAAIVLNGNANVPENVLKAAKAAKCTLRLKTDGLASITIDPAESTAGFNAAVSVSESYSEIMLDEGAVPAFTMTTGTRTVYAFKTPRITVSLGGAFSGKSATLMKYEGGRYVGVTTAAINADGTVTFDFAGISGGSYYIAVGARNYLENDVNGDNKVDVLDASLVLKQVFGVLTEEEREGLNFNRVIPANEKLSIADAQRILKQSFGV